MSRLPAVLRRRDAQVALLAVLVLLLIVFVVARGDDDGVELERGTPAFSLRGDLADDDDLLTNAAEAWIEDDREEEAERGDAHDEVFGDDRRRVSVLWAGKIGDTTTVVATHTSTAAFIEQRDGEDFWQVSTTRLAGSAEAPAVIAFGDGVLLPDGVAATFVPATSKPLRVVDRDGLRIALSSSGGGGTSFSDGVLLMPDGVGARSIDDDPTVVVTGSASRVRRLTPDLAERLQQGTFDLAAMRRFVAAAGGDDRTRTQPEARVPLAAPTLSLVTDEDLPGIGPTMVLSEDDADRSRRVLAAAGAPADGGDEAESIPLDPGEAGTEGVRDREGPGLAAAYVFRNERPRDDPDTSADDDEDDLDVTTGPFLLVSGGRDVASIEVRVGTRRIVRDGPVAVIDATWARIDDPTGRAVGSDVVGRDVSVVGTTKAGRVVVPARLPDGPVVVGED